MQDSILKMRVPDLDPHVPTAVREVQASDASSGLRDLGGYRMVYVVLRDGRAVLGIACLPVSGGSVEGERLLECVRSLAWTLWRRGVAPAKPAARRGPVSVVVCTRNRTDLLRDCLASVMPLVERGHEAIVVDNRPSDDSTARLVASCPGVRYVREMRPGEGAARNCGLRAASHGIVAFTDDDARVDAGWLDALIEPFEDPMVAVATGITMPLELETPAQIWFEKTNGFARGFTRMVFDSSTLAPIGAGRAGASANMAVRKEHLAETGWFDEALGCGTRARCGTDHEFYYRVLARGFRIVYEPSALVWHRHRREWRALRRTIFDYGAGLYAWWTRAAVVERDLTAIPQGAAWFLKYHAVNLARAILRRPGCDPLDLAAAEFAGALTGPFAYFRSARALHSRAETARAEADTAGATVAGG